jgi:AraC family transcriptional regulator
MTVKIVERPALTVVGLRILTKPMSPEIPALWPEFVPRIEEIADAVEPNVSYGVMRHGAALEYMAAVSVSGTGPVPAGMHSLELPAGKYAVFRYPLSGLAKGFADIFDRLMPASGYVQSAGLPFFERYDENFDPGKPDSAVEIYLPVRPRDAAASR